MLRLAEKSEELKTDSPLNILVMGPTNYRHVLQMQLQMVEQRQQEKIPNTVLIVEHTPVITLGARQTANRLLTPRVELEQRQIDVIDIRRGGGATAHNPGQLVFYPIINLKQLNLDVGEYVRTLEDIGIELLEQLGVRSQQKKGSARPVGRQEKNRLHRRPHRKIRHLSRNGYKHPERPVDFRFDRPLRTRRRKNDFRLRTNRQTIFDGPAERKTCRNCS